MNKLDKMMEVYAANIRQLLALARSIVCESSEAEDVLQDVILKLLSEPESCERVNNPLAFLRACVRNEAIDHARRQGRAVPTADELLAGIREESSAEEYKRIEDLMWIRSYIGSLSPEMQQAFIAYAVDGYTIAQTARQLGIPQDTLRKRFNAVKKKMREGGKSNGRQ